MSDRELYKEIDTAKKYNAYKELPDYIPENLNPRMELREYQKAAFLIKCEKICYLPL